MIEVASPAWSATLSRAVSRAVLITTQDQHVIAGQTPTVALTHLASAVLLVAQGQPVPSLVGESWTGHTALLTRSLRRGIMAERADGFSSDTDALHLIDALDQVEAACAADVAARFTEQLGGPHALDLLVEVAHDIRSPIGSLLLLVDRIRKGQSGPINATQEHQLGLVYAAAFGLSALTSDVMELARGGARLVGPTPVLFSVGEVMRLVCELVQPIAEEKGLALKFDGDDDVPRLGHPAAIYRVMLNLATNALKFTNTGEVVLGVRVAEGDVVLFTVRDTGRGMPANVLESLYEAFQKRERTGEYAFSSTGLGLAICQKLVAAMGGTLSVASSPENGSQFSFELALPAAARA